MKNKVIRALSTLTLDAMLVLSLDSCPNPMNMDYSFKDPKDNPVVQDYVSDVEPYSLGIFPNVFPESVLYNPEYRDDEDLIMTTDQLVSKYDSNYSIYDLDSMTVEWDMPEGGDTGINFYELLHRRFLEDEAPKIIEDISPTNTPEFYIDHLDGGFYVMGVRSVGINVDGGTISEDLSEIHSSIDSSADPTNGWIVRAGNYNFPGISDNSWPSESNLEGLVSTFKGGTMTKGEFSLNVTAYSNGGPEL